MKKFMSKIAHWESGEYVYRIYRCRELVFGYIMVESSGNDHRHYVVFPGHPIKIELVTTYDIDGDGIEQKLIDIAEEAWLHEDMGNAMTKEDRATLTALSSPKNINN